MRFLLIAFLFLSGFSLHAQELLYRKETLFMANGTSRHGWIAFNNYTDEVYFKTRLKDQPIRYSARDIAGFFYEGQEYAVLPYQNDFLSIFKLKYQGKEFAVLEKQATPKFIDHVMDQFSRKHVICNKENSDTLYICPLIVVGGGGPTVMLNAAPGVPMSSSNTGGQYVTDTSRQYAVEKVIYLATGNTMDFWSLEMTYFEDGKSPERITGPSSKREIKKMLQPYGLTAEKQERLIAYTRKHQLDLKRSDQLIQAFKSLEN